MPYHRETSVSLSNECYNTLSHLNTNTELSQLNGQKDHSLSWNPLEAQKFVKLKGMNWVFSGLMCVGIINGSGISRLPVINQMCTFWFGLTLNLIVALLSMSLALLIGESWLIMLRLWPEMGMINCRRAYAELGRRSMGKKATLIVSIAQNMAQFSIAIVFLLVSAENVTSFLNNIFSFFPNKCTVLAVLSVVFLPTLFLKSAYELRWVVILGLLCTFVAVLLLMYGAALDYTVCAKIAEQSNFKMINAFMAISSLTFAYGGHTNFPSIINDMKQPADFFKSVVFAFKFLSCYLPVIIITYYVYGNSMRDTATASIQVLWVREVIKLLVALHNMLTLAFLLNPLNQDLEEYLCIEYDFNFWRLVARTVVMCLVLLIAFSVPTTVNVIYFFGGSAVFISCFLFPILFYLYLKARELRHQQLGTEYVNKPCTIKEVVYYNDTYLVVVCSLLLVSGIIWGITFTIFNIIETPIFEFQKPCYIKVFELDSFEHTFAGVNCCGVFQNVSTIKKNSSLMFCNPSSPLH